MKLKKGKKEEFPWRNGIIEKVAGVAIQKAKEALPLIQEKAKEVSPEIAERIEGIIPGEEIPEKDVGGEDIAGIPRGPNMIRISFNTTATLTSIKSIHRWTSYLRNLSRTLIREQVSSVLYGFLLKFSRWKSGQGQNWIPVFTGMTKKSL